MKTFLGVIVLSLALTPQALAGTLYVDTGGNAAYSGSTDSASPTISGTVSTVSGATIILEAGTDFSGLTCTAGSASQSTIYLTNASNSNQKIFWCTLATGSGGATPTLTLTPTPTCASNLCGVWNVGGRHLLTSASIEAACRAGDTVIFNNSPASANAAIWTFRNAGTSAAGPCTIRGKTGVRPVLTATGTTNVITTNALFNTWVENLELVQQGASGAAMLMSGTLGTAFNVKISDAGGVGVQMNDNGNRVINCEITGVGTDGVNINGTNSVVKGCYIHDLPGDCIEQTSPSSVNVIVYNILDTCAARGIYYSAATGTGVTTNNLIDGNTIYGNGDSGLEVTDADTVLVVRNNIFVNNGNAANEYNVEWAAGTAEYVSVHGYNDFYTTGGGGSANLLNLTANGTETTSDPLMTSPSTGDFTLGSTSPAKATGYPGVFLGSSTGYIDMGAVQRQEPASSGGGIIGG